MISCRASIAGVVLVVAFTAGNTQLLAQQAAGTTPDAQNPAKDTAAKAKQPEPLTPEAQAVAKELRQKLPADSEPLRMLEAIIAGSELGPGEGWFESSDRHSRFGWAEVAAAYDKDADSTITAEEFGGENESFAAVDQNQDRKLTDKDFDWSEQYMSRNPGAMLFFAADADANGKVTADEFQTVFERLDAGGTGFLSQDDVRSLFQRPPSANEKQPDDPTPSTLVLGLQRQEIGSLQPGPAIDDSLIDFTLRSLDGSQVTLSEEVGDKPIVLIFGNFTCGPFRSQAGNIEKFYGKYRDRAKFFMIYVREAHPAEGWWMTSNSRVGIKVSQPQTSEERFEVAARCREHLELISDLPFLVDDINDNAGTAYSGMPNRLYVIDTTGKIAFKNGRGPFGFKLRELEQALALLFHATQSDVKQE